MAAYVDAFNKLVPQMQARVPPPRVAQAKKRALRLPSPPSIAMLRAP